MAKIKVTQFTIPLTTFSVGPLGPFTTQTLPTTLRGYQFDFVNDDTWPASGEVMTITVEMSNDDGQSWQFDASITLAGGIWKDRQGNVIHTSGWDVSVAQDSPTRKVRFSINVLQVCTLGATLTSF